MTAAPVSSRDSSGVPSRNVARPVANLGNTCYANAVLQALSHAPELLLAMDTEPHSLTCPVAAENALKRLRQSQSSSSSPEADPAPRKGTRKSRRSSGRKSPRVIGNGSVSNTELQQQQQGGNTNTGSDNDNDANIIIDDDALQYCALCEVENHIHQVHDPRCKDKPFAPTTFVHGFIEHVAPWFKLGVQEDSHEFLRLLIDAMQTSCQKARNNGLVPSTMITSQDNPQDDIKASVPITTTTSSCAEDDKEYPFSLFRGMVESNVICDSCKASSATLDPIEDIGLEVTADTTSASTTTSGANGNNASSQDHHASSSHSSTRTLPASLSSSRNSSPTPIALADVQTAFYRFAKAEALDCGYKCETCGKVGRATKQSRLAKIPPILTLHLKRFRYGGIDPSYSMRNNNSSTLSGGGGNIGGGGGANNAAGGGGGAAVLPTVATTRQRRSEVNQLLSTCGATGGGSSGGDFFTGKSGSAKIEGHIKFDQCFDLRPYLTDALQKTNKSMLCRLFAVIVHAGKNSHSGHYVAYVLSLEKGSKNWWKMDDGRVCSAQIEEVMQAEAYMLFYRVVQHSVTQQLEAQHKNKIAGTTTMSIPTSATISVTTDGGDDEDDDDADGSSKKRKSLFEDGRDWAHKRNLKPHWLSLVRRAEELIAKEAVAELSDDAVVDIQESDVVGGTKNMRQELYELFYKLAEYLGKKDSSLEWGLDEREAIDAADPTPPASAAASAAPMEQQQQPETTTAADVL